MVAPNVASFGNTYEDSHVEKCQDDVEAQLKQDDYQMVVRRCQLCFAPESFHSSTRSLVHPMWVCVASATDANGKLLSRFTESVLWHHRACVGIKAKNVADFVNPVQSISIQLNTVSLSKAQQYKQHLTGADMWMKIKDSLWKGLEGNCSPAVAYVNVLPYDHSLIQACLKTSILGACRSSSARGSHQSCVGLLR